MKAIYQKITGRLKTVTAIKWIDADNGQIDFYDTRPPVAFPCALVDIELPDCQNIGSKSQLVTARVTVRLAFEPLGQTNTAAPVSTQNAALAKWDVVDAVFAALQGWGDSEISGLQRLSQVTEKRDDNFRVITQTWETTFEETVPEPEDE